MEKSNTIDELRSLSREIHDVRQMVYGNMMYCEQKISASICDANPILLSRFKDVRSRLRAVLSIYDGIQSDIHFD